MSNSLTPSQYEQYLRVHRSIMIYAGKQQGSLPPRLITVENYASEMSAEFKVAVRNYLYEHPKLIERFIAENPMQLAPADLAMVHNLYHRIEGQFFLYQYFKDHSIFIQDDRVYAVKDLGGFLRELIDPSQLPAYVMTVLLPWDGVIVYDGLISYRTIYFGKGLKQQLKVAYEEAKATGRIITTLPAQLDPVDPLEQATARLDVYMKTAANREAYAYEIEELLQKYPNLQPRYHWHWAKYHARQHKKFLQSLGVKKRHFALTHNSILASGTNRAEVEKQVKAMLSAEQLEGVYYFSV